MSEWLWFWQDKKELALWKKLNSLTTKERQSSKYKDICLEKARQYGGIYFFKPYPEQVPILEDEAIVLIIHGNNSSGKSYVACAKVAYHVMGWSPYFTVPKPKYGNKLIWIFTPNYDIQRASSQVHLFSTDNPNSIGLLPSLEVIKEMGGKVQWNRKEALEFVRFPDGTVIEYKSEEAKSIGVAAAGVDIVYFDERPDQTKYDEGLARVLRKDGRLIMSFISDDPATDYIVQDIYTRYEQEHQKDQLKAHPNWNLEKHPGISPSGVSFHFLEVSDNKSLDEDSIASRTGMFTGKGQIWRFTRGGRFEIVQTGDVLYPNFSEDLHVKDDLLLQYDPMRTLYRSWDLGSKRPCCTGFQVSEKGHIRFLFCILGLNIQLTDFIDEIESFCLNNMPKIVDKFELLPHDAKRHYDIAPVSSEDIFEAKGLKEKTVLYTKRLPGIQLVNDKLKQLRDKQAMIQIDSKYCVPLIQCLMGHKIDPKTGEAKEDGYYEHITDVLKQAVSYVHRILTGDDIAVSKAPGYFPLDVVHG